MVQGGGPSLLALLLGEVGVADPEVEFRLLRYPKSTTTIIHIDVGHVNVVLGGGCGVVETNCTILAICER